MKKAAVMPMEKEEVGLNVYLILYCSLLLKLLFIHFFYNLWFMVHIMNSVKCIMSVNLSSVCFCIADIIKIQPAVLQIAWWSWENQTLEVQNRFWDFTKRQEASGKQKNHWDTAQSYSRASGISDLQEIYLFSLICVCITKEIIMTYVLCSLEMKVWAWN